MNSEYKTILFKKSIEKVATVTINRPEAMNSFNVKMMEEFRTLWQHIAHDDDINAVVLRASEGRAFCTGMDVRSGENMMRSDQLWNKTDPGELLAPKVNGCWKPLICAVHGLCGGGGFYFLSEADIIICSPEAEFFDPHVSYGMTAALEPVAMSYRMPLSEVMRMTLLGNDERICAETALRISLVTEIVERESLWKRAHELAAMVASKPSVATQGSIRAIWESLDMGRSSALQQGLKYCLLGREEGTAQVDREAVMSSAKKYSVR